MMLLYSHNNSPRLQYIVDVIFNQWLNINCEITTDKQAFESFSGVKISYGENFSDNQIVTLPKNTEILFESDIKKQDLQKGQIEETITLFHQDKKYGDLPFDIFAATFWMITRYEEYLEQKRDTHGRFLAEHSFAFQNNIVQKPIVNYWLAIFKQAIQKKYPQLRFNEQTFQFIDTVDVDNAFAFKGKGFARNLGGILRDIKSPEWLKKRINVLLGKEPDPFDTYEWHIEVTRNKNITKQIYFFLVGNYTMYDKNVPFDYPLLKKRIQFLQKQNVEIGLHPSYLSNENVHQLQIEKERLELIAETQIVSSRQHFLKLNLPQTYENLLRLGIKNDYTLGFAELPGFRAGVCLPFTFFNLKKNKPEALKIFPLTAMDATFRYYLKFTPEQAIFEYQKLLDEVKKFNGTFVSLWHNDAFSNTENWKNWQQVYLAILNML